MSDPTKPGSAPGCHYCGSLHFVSLWKIQWSQNALCTHRSSSRTTQGSRQTPCLYPTLSLSGCLPNCFDKQDSFFFFFFCYKMGIVYMAIYTFRPKCVCVYLLLFQSSALAMRHKITSNHRHKGVVLIMRHRERRDAGVC